MIFQFNTVTPGQSGVEISRENFMKFRTEFSAVKGDGVYPALEKLCAGVTPLPDSLPFAAEFSQIKSLLTSPASLTFAGEAMKLVGSNFAGQDYTWFVLRPQ